jgi:hypothetical protein
VSRPPGNATRRLTIKSMNRKHPIHMVDPSDFTWGPGAEIDPEEVLLDPSITLYCIDPENDSALFVQSGDQVAVDQAPFYYQTQVEQAIGLVSMPLDVFHRVGKTISEPPGGLIFVHSVGRCGSTLMSKALAAVPEVHSLSEPDDLTQIGHLRVAHQFQSEWIRDLIRSSVAWRCKPRSGPPADRVAIKMRSEVMVLADLLGPTFPDSSHLFLYRDAVSWMGSVFWGWPADRDVYDEELNRAMMTSWARSLPIVLEYMDRDPPLNAIQIRTLAWINCMEAYLTFVEAGIPICAARFEDLTKTPGPTLARLMEFCGIEVNDWDAIHEVLGRDSQAGTVYDREARSKAGRELTPDLAREVTEMVASRPLLQTPDALLPGTV